jgi:hypothetical protein
VLAVFTIMKLAHSRFLFGVVSYGDKDLRFRARAEGAIIRSVASLSTELTDRVNSE